MKSMKKITIVWGIMMVLIFALLAVFGILHTQKLEGYRELERKLANASKQYIELNVSYRDVENGIRITLEQLKAEGLIEELKKDGEECEGYAFVSKPRMVVVYQGFIKCPGYTTRGFSE